MPLPLRLQFAPVLLGAGLLGAGLLATCGGREGVEPTADGGGLGPILQFTVKKLWEQAFDPGSGIYLPDIVAHGYPSLHLPSYDPYQTSGTSSEVPVKVEASVADSACISTLSPPPIASDDPRLTFENVLLVNLHALEAGSLSFSDTEPTFTAVVNFGHLPGGQTLPLLLLPSDWDGAGVSDWAACLADWAGCARPTGDAYKTLHKSTATNSGFAVACCVPTAAGSRQCGTAHPAWQATAGGPFLAVLGEGTLTATVELTTAGSDLKVTIRSLSLAVPGQVPPRVLVDVDGLPSWSQGMVQVAVNQGVYSGAALASVNAFLDSPAVRGDLQKLLQDLVNRNWQASQP